MALIRGSAAQIIIDYKHSMAALAGYGGQESGTAWTVYGVEFDAVNRLLSTNG
jgi:hypothetical protein